MNLKSLKRKTTVTAVVTAVVAITVSFLLFLGLTSPIIDKYDRLGDVSSAGGGYSVADVMYIDNRPILKKGGAADVWWGTSGGEWRRLEWYSYRSRSLGSVAILRGSANIWSSFGISRGTPKAERLQEEYDQIRKDHDQQSFLFDRVSYWRLQR